MENHEDSVSGAETEGEPQPSPATVDAPIKDPVELLAWIQEQLKFLDTK